MILENLKKFNREVRIVSVDKRYRKSSYPAIPYFDPELRTYVTGQHIDPSDPSTKGNLTSDEIKNPEKMSAERRLKFPYIIKYDDTINIQHLKKYNLTLDANGEFNNVQDAIYMAFIMHQHIVAKCQSDVRKGRHLFYVEDKEAEAEKKIETRELRFKAESKIYGMRYNELKDVALMLNYYEKSVNLSIDNLSETQLRNGILDTCEKFPKSVLNCFEKNAEDDLFILKVIDKKGIIRKGTGYYDGNVHVGDDVPAIRAFLKTKDGRHYTARWSKILQGQEAPNITEFDDNVPEKSFNPQKGPNIDKLLTDCAFALFDKNIELANKYILEAEVINKDDIRIKSLKTQIENIIKENNSKNSNSQKSISEDDLRIEYDAKDLTSLKKIAGGKKLPKEEWKEFEKPELIDYLIKKEFSK